MSERLIVSHYENNYCGAVKRLNLIVEQLAGLDPAPAPGYLLNGLKREELVAINSMILDALFFDGLANQASPARRCARRSPATSARTSAGAPSSSPWARRSVADRAGCCWRGRRATAGSSISGPDHCHTLAGSTPILALDMYEHSYHLDFGAKAAGYVDAFMDAVQWKNVERLLGNAVRN